MRTALLVKYQVRGRVNGLAGWESWLPDASATALREAPLACFEDPERWDPLHCFYAIQNFRRGKLTTTARRVLTTEATVPARVALIPRVPMQKSVT